MPIAVVVDFKLGDYFEPRPCWRPIPDIAKKFALNGRKVKTLPSARPKGATVEWRGSRAIVTIITQKAG